MTQHGDVRGVVSSWLKPYDVPGQKYPNYLHIRLRRQDKPHPSPRREYDIKPCHRDA